MASFLIVIILLPFLCCASNIITFVQITDIHYDPAYNGFENPSNDCNGNDNNGVEYPYGQYGCDSPSLLIDALVDSLKELPHNPTFISMTGDNVGHTVDTEDDTLNAFGIPISKLLSALPNVPIYQVIGNNDLYPKNTLPDTNSEYLKKLQAKLQSLVSFPESVWVTFSEGGYYSHTPVTGLRMIVMNTIFYFTDYTDDNPPLTDDTDPAGQFAWLEKVLARAKYDGEKIIITSHMGLGGSRQSNLIWKSKYVREFMTIIEPYSSNILMLLDGHSHRDMFNLLYPIGTPALNASHNIPEQAPFAVSLNGASVAPGAYNNPSYRVFFVDTDSMEIVDYQHVAFDFTTLQWSTYYTFSKMTGGLKPNTLGFWTLYKRLQSGAWPSGPSSKSLCNYISTIWATNSIYIWNDPNEYVSKCWDLYCSITQLTKDALDACIQDPPVGLDVCFDSKDCQPPIQPAAAQVFV